MDYFNGDLTLEKLSRLMGENNLRCDHGWTFLVALFKCDYDCDHFGRRHVKVPRRAEVHKAGAATVHGRAVPAAAWGPPWRKGGEVERGGQVHRMSSTASTWDLRGYRVGQKHVGVPSAVIVNLAAHQ